MGITWKTGSLNGLIDAVPRMFNSFMDEAEKILEDVLRIGSDLMEGYIQTRGLSGKAGRIDTGKMLESVGWNMTSSTGVVLSGEFGWTESQELYFLFQEEGTSRIAPMLALFDAGASVREELVSAIAAALARTGG